MILYAKTHFKAHEEVDSGHVNALKHSHYLHQIATLATEDNSAPGTSKNTCGVDFQKLQLCTNSNSRKKKLRSMEYLYKWCPNFFWNAFDVARWRCVGSQADVSKHRRQHNKGSSCHLSQGSRQWSQLLQREGYQAITGDESCKLLSRGLPKMPLNSIYLVDTNVNTLYNIMRIPCAVLCTVVLLYSK